jgi:hypothetical protein
LGFILVNWKWKVTAKCGGDSGGKKGKNSPAKADAPKSSKNKRAKINKKTKEKCKIQKIRKLPRTTTKRSEFQKEYGNSIKRGRKYQNKNRGDNNRRELGLLESQITN